MLLGLGYDVPAVISTATEAIRETSKHKPRLVLMDVMLQGEMSGLEAADKIYTKFNIPVVYLTAYADETTLERAKKTTPFGYLLKPFEERELKTTIEIALYKFKMEQKLKNRERWLSTILNSIGDGVVATDQYGNINFLNPCAEDIIGRKLGAVQGKPLQDVLNIVSEKTGKPLKIPVNKILHRERFRLQSEVIMLSKDRISTNVHQNAAAILDDTGSVSGLVMTFSDITRSKLAEEELRISWERQKSAMEGTVQAMAFTIETRDPYTAGHQRRVTKLAQAIAQKMGLNHNHVEGVRMAGELHDIGKIYVPAEILSKPGKISEVEYNIIKTHPQVGYDILQSIDFPWPIAEIVLQHHERIDGSGYPSGLMKNKIHIEARILAVADVIEAMATHRPYRPALSIEEALDEISKNKGTKYDSKVADACLLIFENQEFKFDQQ